MPLESGCDRGKSGNTATMLTTCTHAGYTDCLLSAAYYWLFVAGSVLLLAGSLIATNCSPSVDRCMQLTVSCSQSGSAADSARCRLRADHLRAVHYGQLAIDFPLHANSSCLLTISLSLSSAVLSIGCSLSSAHYQPIATSLSLSAVLTIVCSLSSAHYRLLTISLSLSASTQSRLLQLTHNPLVIAYNNTQLRVSIIINFT